jgi:hypothetical protein
LQSLGRLLEPFIADRQAVRGQSQLALDTITGYLDVADLIGLAYRPSGFGITQF